MWARYKSCFGVLGAMTMVLFWGAVACGPTTTLGPDDCPEGETMNDEGVCVPIDDAGITDPTDTNGETDDDGGGGEVVDAEIPAVWTDTSGDGVPDIYDNCPNHYNPEQEDRDTDGVGDVCDNCPDHYNPDQTDSLMDGVGDACSETPAGDLCGEILVEFQYIDPPNPNIYISVDESGSMGWDTPTRMSRVKDGLTQMANLAADDVRLGLGGFSGSCGSGAIRHLLDIGQHTAQTFINSVGNLNTGGGTPMHEAPRDVRVNNRLEDTSDPLNDERVKALVLINDGAPNNCSCASGLDCDSSSCAAAVTCEIAKLYNDHGITTYVVGFAFASDTLNDFAEAGNTNNPDDPNNRYFSADDGASLAAVLQTISEELIVIECNYLIDPPPPSIGQIWVNFDNRWLEPHEYSYDEVTSVLSLSSEACDELHQLVGGPEDNLEIIIGCPICLPPGEECPPEWCGEDWEQDPDCDDCLPKGAYCQVDEDCCPPLECVEQETEFGTEKICWPPCYPVHTPCQTTEDCCPPLECWNGKCSHDDLG